MKKSVYLSILLAAILLPFSVDAYTFLRNLKQGDSGQDVLELQKALNINASTRVSVSGAGSPGQETTYFGNATRKAVIAFQELYMNEVLYPAGLLKGTGFVGVLTRQKLNSLNTNKTAPVATQATVSSGAPVITSLSSNTIGNGDRLVIYGKNFQSKNTILIDIELENKYVDIYTASSTSIEIVFNSTVSEGLKQRLNVFSTEVKGAILDQIKENMGKQSPSADGNWYYPANIMIRNQFGTSNSLPVKINILKGV